MSDDGPGNKRRESAFGGTPLPPPGMPFTPPVSGPPAAPPPPFGGDPVASPLTPPAGQGWYVAPPAKKSRRGRAIIATVGAVAVLAGGTFAAVALSSSDGAATPSAAVAGFFDAVDHEDVIGMLDALPAGERDAMRPIAEELNAEMQRLGITSKIDLGQVKGLDFEVAGLKMHSEDLGDGVAGVWIDSGTITVSVVPQDVPIGDNLKNLIEHVTGSPVTITASSESDQLHMDASANPIVTIKDGDGWKLSAFYTLAESIRRDSDAPLPAFGQGVDAVGSDSPEAAVKALVDATVAYDVERIVALTPPEEMKALHDYAPLFLPDAEQAIAEMKSNTDVVVTITRLDLDASGSGDRRSVTITGGALHVASSDVNGDVDFDGKCITVTGDLADQGSTGSKKSCTGDISPAVEDLGLGDLVGRVSNPFTITVVNEGGKWYVSPVGTVGEAFVNVLRALKPEDFQEGGLAYKGIDALQNLGSEFSGVGG
jgi:hypothetical protein